MQVKMSSVSERKKAGISRSGIATDVGASRSRLSVLLGAVLFLSGAAALVYQVLWARQLTLVVGVEVYSITVAVSAFFAGLAGGGAVLGRVADRVASTMRLYAVLEVAVALCAVATTLCAASCCGAVCVDAGACWSSGVDVAVCAGGSAGVRDGRDASGCGARVASEWSRGGERGRAALRGEYGGRNCGRAGGELCVVAVVRGARRGVGGGLFESDGCGNGICDGSAWGYGRCGRGAGRGWRWDRGH